VATAKCQYIADDLRERLHNGMLPLEQEGRGGPSKLPGEKELATEYQASRSTAGDRRHHARFLVEVGGHTAGPPAAAVAVVTFGRGPAGTTFLIGPPSALYCSVAATKSAMT
jgi:hypothetical protein